MQVIQEVGCEMLKCITSYPGETVTATTIANRKKQISNRVQSSAEQLDYLDLPPVVSLQLLCTFTPINFLLPHFSSVRLRGFE